MVNEQPDVEARKITREDVVQELKEFLSDDEITALFESLDTDKTAKKIIRTSQWFQLAHYALVILLVIFFGISSVTMGFIAFAPNRWIGFSDFFFVLAMATFAVLVTLDLIEKRVRNVSLKQARHQATTKVNMMLLEKFHPDLYAFHEVTNMFNEEKDEAATRRDFWVGIAVNFAFLVLGILISYTLVKLGWLR